MTLMYTFSRRGRVGAADHARRGLEKCPPCLELHTFTVPLPTRRCPLHGAAANPTLLPSRCRCQLGAAICVVRPGAGEPSTGM